MNLILQISISKFQINGSFIHRGDCLPFRIFSFQRGCMCNDFSNYFISAILWVMGARSIVLLEEGLQRYCKQASLANFVINPCFINVSLTEFLLSLIYSFPDLILF